MFAEMASLLVSSGLINRSRSGRRWKNEGEVQVGLRPGQIQDQSSVFVSLYAEIEPAHIEHYVHFRQTTKLRYA